MWKRREETEGVEGEAPEQEVVEETATDPGQELQARAKQLIRAYGITFGWSRDRRCIYADNVPQPDLEVVREALRQNLV